MSGVQNSELQVKQTEVNEIVWGADAIGRVIGRNARQTHHLLNAEPPQITSARKVGGLWCASRVALLREFGA
jgi:hypothetical protein